MTGQVDSNAVQHHSDPPQEYLVLRAHAHSTVGRGHYGQEPKTTGRCLLAMDWRLIRWLCVRDSPLDVLQIIMNVELHCWGNDLGVTGCCRLLL